MLVFESANAKLYHGNSLNILKDFPDNSIDSIVTDPPYGLSNTTPELVATTIGKWISGERDFIPDGKGFMGKEWDAFVPPPAIWDECLRVLKPGGHMLAFFGSRTQDIGALAMRLAGFEIRDTLQWIFGQGFPKSHNVALGIDKLEAHANRGRAIPVASKYQASDKKEENKLTSNPVDEYQGKSERSQQWEGWGTALKPAYEPIILARKPLNGTVAQTVLQYGTGGINIDGSRIGAEEIKINTFDNGAKPFGNAVGEPYTTRSVIGRWPSNLILDEEAARLLDEQSGNIPGRLGMQKLTDYQFKAGEAFETQKFSNKNSTYDKGGASRFFYTSKASKRDRNEGLEELPIVSAAERVDRQPDSAGMNSPRAGAGRTHGAANFHSTVKPTDLMQYLVNLITPPNGTVLDPFTGSGSTGKAAILKGFNFIGVEITDEYLPIIKGRLAHAQEQRDKTEGETLF